MSERRAWKAILCPVDTGTSDKRILKSEGFSHRELPFSLTCQFSNEPEHGGAVPVGSINEIWIEDGNVWGSGWFGSVPDGIKAAQYVEEEILNGVSVDLVETDGFVDDAGNAVFTKWRIAAATICAVQAFEVARISLVASGAPEAFTVNPTTFAFDVWNIPVNPPKKMFEYSSPKELYNVRVESNGNIHGYVADWVSCHISHGGSCVVAPKSARLDTFMNKGVFAADGTDVSTGVLFVGTDHAKGNVSADVALDHYANTGAAVADVKVFADDKGLFITGCLRPDLSASQLRVVKGTDWSGDWRKVRSAKFARGEWSLVGILGVNVGGFIVASGEPVVGVDEFGDAVSLFSGVTSFGVNDVMISDEEFFVMKNDSVEVALSVDAVSLSLISDQVRDAVSAGFAAGLAAVKTVESVDVPTVVDATLSCGCGKPNMSVVADEPVVEDMVDSLEVVKSEFAAEIASLKDMFTSFVESFNAEREAAMLSSEFEGLFD
jgi:hypothetical protein